MSWKANKIYEEELLDKLYKIYLSIFQVANIIMKIRDFISTDKDNYFKMSKDFYSGGATLFGADDKKIEHAFKQALKKSPYMRGLILENNNEVVGYALLTYT